MKLMVENRVAELSVDAALQTGFPEHLHSQIEIMMPTSGVLHACVDGTAYSISPGEALFVFPNHIHMYVEQEPVPVLMVIYSPSVLPSVHMDWDSTQPTSPVAAHLTQDAVYARDRLLELAASSQHEREKLALVHLLSVSLISVLQVEDADKPVISDILYSALKYISDNYTGEITLRKVARAIGASEYYLSHLMNMRLHTDFRRYVNLLRVDLARQLLIQKSIPVEEVAFQCGFSNLRSFDRVFGQICGCTPRDYRKQLHHPNE